VARSRGEKVRLKMFGMRFVDTWAGRRVAVYTRQVPQVRRFRAL
jgi:hypothetical protein